MILCWKQIIEVCHGFLDTTIIFLPLSLKVFIPETSSSTDVRVSSIHLPDSSSVAQSTSVSSVSTVTQSVLVSESAQVLVHSSAVSDGAMVVSDSTASTSSDLGSAIDKIIESTIGPDIMNGIFTDTSLPFIPFKEVDIWCVCFLSVRLHSCHQCRRWGCGNNPVSNITRSRWWWGCYCSSQFITSLVNFKTFLK